MKNKLALTLLVFIGLSSATNSSQAYAQQGSLNSRIILSAPSDTAAKANKNSTDMSSSYSDIMNDPLINSTLNSFGNMMQGMNGASCDAQERMKQQVDYIKQQSKYSEGNGE